MLLWKREEAQLIWNKWLSRRIVLCNQFSVDVFQMVIVIAVVAACYTDPNFRQNGDVNPCSYMTLKSSNVNINLYKPYLYCTIQPFAKR